MTITDDLGAPVPRTVPRSRVVSLVPSLTESIAATRPEALVGATSWCTHPADLDARGVTRVRGTKNPDINRIIELRPDLVLTNQEENRRVDVERLRAAGIAVWVTVIESVPQALESLRRMFVEGLGWEVPTWLDEADEAWRRPPPARRLRAAVPIWRNPWMVVGSRTFTGDLLARVGVDNVFSDSVDRYPKVTVEEILARTPDVVLLPDEPYIFTAVDGPEAFDGPRTALIPGRAITWYGPSLTDARALVVRALDARVAGG